MGNPLTPASPGRNSYRIAFVVHPGELLGPGPSHTQLSQPCSTRASFCTPAISSMLSPLKAWFADASNLGLFVQKLSWRCFGFKLSYNQVFVSFFSWITSFEAVVELCNWWATGECVSAPASRSLGLHVQCNNRYESLTCIEAAHAVPTATFFESVPSQKHKTTQTVSAGPKTGLGCYSALNNV